MDFERVAAAWGRWWPVLERGSRAVSLRLIEAARLSPGARVLDIATGVGEPAISAAKVVAPDGRVTAIDVSPAMIRLARERAEREGVNNVEFVEADAGSYGGGGGDFDAVLSRFGLMFVPRLNAALTHYRSMLRPGGRFAAATWCAPPEVPVISLPMAIATRRFNLEPPLLAGGPFALNDAEALKARFVATGYENVEVDDLVADYPFASAGEYFEHVCDVAPPLIALLRQLDEAQIAELYNEIERVIGERYTRADGTILMANRVLVVSASAPG